MEAAQFVVSDAAAALWESVRERHGFARFAATAAVQLPRWESAYGWSRSGWGRLAGNEISLAAVLGRMLSVPDAWTAFADRYLDALDEIARSEARESASRAPLAATLARTTFVMTGPATSLSGTHCSWSG